MSEGSDIRAVKHEWLLSVLAATGLDQQDFADRMGTDKASYGKISAANTLANRALKVAAKACGINKRLTTHMARHTFMQQGLEAEVHDRTGVAAVRHARGLVFRGVLLQPGVVRRDF